MLGEWFDNAARRANTDPFGGGGFGGSWSVVVLAIAMLIVYCGWNFVVATLKVKLSCLICFRYILELQVYSERYNRPRDSGRSDINTV